MREKQALTRTLRERYQKAARRQKAAMINEFVAATGYNRKYALRLLNRKPPKTVTVYANGITVKLKPARMPVFRLGVLPLRVCFLVCT